MTEVRNTPNTPYRIRGLRSDSQDIIFEDENPGFFGVYEIVNGLQRHHQDFNTREEAEKHVRLLTLSSPINGTEFNEIAQR